ncbi:extracellular solute-binding protein [Paenibacillus sp. LHD-117]|uniref:extracellular solute-binding protein n=1 Tax=Paenibacillus sp. LHD-117 TaxID=3071412 RepID=UPI0027DF29B7|nr:extracellular solute-binding protein [Paenibacillus sp. LHD-117]MDQ6419483.1 extracellular solute-binding protein [Paenibacillus sp. LHD-117]
MKAFSSKGTLIAMSFILTATLMSACGKDNNSNAGENTGNAGNGGTATETPAENAYKDKYDPPVTITTVWGIDPELKFKNGESIENNVATAWAKDTLGIDIKSLWSVTDSNNAFATKMRLALTSGEQIPDVVTIGDAQLAQDLIDSGLFREAGSLFDQYASETWKNAMAIDENVWNPYTRGGERMGIPVLDYAYNHDYLLWIRQDWLDKLGLQAPKTMEELEAVMDKFKNANPDGLKPDQVTPLSIGFKNKMSTWMGDPSWIFGAYGTLPEQWNVGADGKLEYGSVNPGMKQGLETLKGWLEKGYIPQETALWDENKTAEPAVAGTAGIIPGPYWMSGWPLSDTAKNVEGAVWKPYAIPTGPDGKAMRHGTHFTNGVTLISKDMKNPEALFTYQNYMFENYADPKPGSVFDNGLFKNYDYDIAEDGKLLRWEEIPGGYVNSIRYLLVRDGARIPDAQMKALMNLADGKEATTRLEKEVQTAYGLETAGAAKVLLSQEGISFKNMFTGPPTETMSSKNDYLKKLELQTFNEIIYGKKPLEAFDQFVSDWKAGGGDKMSEEVNAWYDSVK